MRRPSSSPPEPFPRIVDAATAQRVARMQYLRAVRRSWDIAPTPRIHALTLYTALAFVAAAASGAFAVYVARLEAESPALLGLFGFLGITCVALLAVAVWLVTLVGRATEWRRPMRDVSRQLAGGLSFDAERRIEWFDRHWLGALSTLDVQPSAYGGAITALVQGYPVLILFDPLPIGQTREARLELFLAASGLSSTAIATDAREWFSRHGFELRESEAGLRVSAARAVVRALDEALGGGPTDEMLPPELDPSGARHWLMPVVHALAATAASAGAQPVAPIP